MNLIDTIDTRNANLLHRLLLDALDDALPLLTANSQTIGNIEDRTYFILGDDRIQFSLINLEALGILNLLNAHIESHHQVLRRLELLDIELLLQFILLDELLEELRSELIRLYTHEGVDALLDDVDGEFAHLAHLFVEGHLLEPLLNLLFHLLIAWNCRLLLSRCRQQRGC